MLADADHGETLSADEVVYTRRVRDFLRAHIMK